MNLYILSILLKINTLVKNVGDSLSIYQ
uniref:Uncharacterized protein n=1 Tax=Arundo donax TaxID=35708 RepID=A0A0A8Z3C0_ARUDO